MRGKELSNKYRTLLGRYEVNTPLRLAHFMAQMDHESGLKPVQENLNYSEQGLLRTFPRYFTPAQAREYARKPERIANRAYANRMGNGDEASGDGWRYRGRGFIQLTGKDNYIALTRESGIDYLNNPDLLLNEADAMISALWYWKRNNINSLADLDNIESVTRRINGGLNGLAHRKQLTEYYKTIFK